MIYTKLKTVLTTSITLLCLSVVTTAHADFRKALDAYQARDGATMLKEVKDAVDKKNDDGLILFISLLELDKSLARAPNSMSKEELIRAEKSGEYIQAPIETFLDEKEITDFFLYLEKAVKQSSEESQYRFYWLASLSKIKINFESWPRLESEMHLSHPKNQFSRAMNYLVGNNVVKNETKGIQLLKLALAKPDAHLYWGSFSNKLSQFYHEKYLKKRNIALLHQAYAWAMVDLTSNGIYTFGIQKTIDEMQKQGLLLKVAPEMNALLSTMPEKIKLESGLSDRERIRKRNKIILADIKNIELPDLILKNHKNDFKKQPVISLRRFVGENVMDGNQVAGVSEFLNYILEAYEDGRVNFNLGSKAINGFYQTQNQEVLLKINPEDVKNVVSIAMNSGFYEAPLYNFNSLKSCVDATCFGKLGNGLGNFEVTYLVTVRDKQNYRTIKYRVRINDEPPDTFKLIEEKFPTQQYRCGTNKVLGYYQYCIKH